MTAGYFVRKALGNFREHTWIHLVSIGIIFFAMTMLGFALILYSNLSHMIQQWGSDIRISVYLTRDMTQSERDWIQLKIGALPGLIESTHVTSEEAFRRFALDLEADRTILDGVDPSVMPESFDLRLDQSAITPHALKQAIDALKQAGGVDDIWYDQQWSDYVARLLELLRVGGVVFGFVLAVAIILIVSNTVTLSMFSRSDELKALRLVGATSLFLHAPFLIEGAMQGLLGSGFAIFALQGLYRLVAWYGPSLLPFGLAGETLIVFADGYDLVLLFGGASIGALGSVIAVRKYSEMKPLESA